MTDKPAKGSNGVARRSVLYLSASLANHALNERLRSRLPDDRIELVLPQEFAPAEVDHPHFPRAIYEQCISEMERCDAGLLLLDSFGVDCASEAGWFAGRGKPLLGIAGATCHFLRHWMVKGNLTGVICLDPLIYKAVKEDPILGRIPLKLHTDPETLGEAVEAMLNVLTKRDANAALASTGVKHDR